MSSSSAAREIIVGETFRLAARHGVSGNLIRVWVTKFEAGAFDEDSEAADPLQECEARIAAIERMVGRRAREIEFLKGAELRHGFETSGCAFSGGQA